MSNIETFKVTYVGTTGITYRWNIQLTLEEYKILKQNLQNIQAVYENGYNYSFVKDHFKELYYISIICFFDINPFNSEKDAEKYMFDDNTYILYSKHPELTQLGTVRYEILKTKNNASQSL